MYYVYRLLNKANQKSYIGITSRTVKERWLEHVSRIKSGRNSRIYAALRKYGQDGFEVITLEETSSEDEVRKLEEDYIKLYDSYSNGYNCNYGGCGTLCFSDEIRKKISKAQIGKVISLETRKKMSEAKLGDTRCAKHFGEHTSKGGKNPRSKYFLIGLPDGTEKAIQGIREFCRDNNLQYAKLSSKGKTKGFSILRRFIDYPEMEYTQVSGNGAYPSGVKI